MPMTLLTRLRRNWELTLYNFLVLKMSQETVYVSKEKLTRFEARDIAYLQILMDKGLLPTAENVVPRSIPITLLINIFLKLIFIWVLFFQLQVYFSSFLSS